MGNSEVTISLPDRAAEMQGALQTVTRSRYTLSVTFKATVYNYDPFHREPLVPLAVITIININTSVIVAMICWSNVGEWGNVTLT